MVTKSKSIIGCKVRYNGQFHIFFGCADLSRYKPGTTFTVEAEGQMGLYHVYKLIGVRGLVCADWFDKVIE